MQPRPISETVNDPRFRCFIAWSAFLDGRCAALEPVGYPRARAVVTWTGDGRLDPRVLVPSPRGRAGSPGRGLGVRGRSGSRQPEPERRRLGGAGAGRGGDRADR